MLQKNGPDRTGPDRDRLSLLLCPLQRRGSPPVPRREAPDCHGPSPEMASFPGLCKAVGPAEENGELDGSLQQMLKAIAEERTRLNLRQEISGLGELWEPRVWSGTSSSRGAAQAPRLLLVSGGSPGVCALHH